MSEPQASAYDARCCLACGRWGNRAYRPADNGVEGWVCVNDRACRQRAVRATSTVTPYRPSAKEQP